MEDVVGVETGDAAAAAAAVVVAAVVEHKWLPEFTITKGTTGWDDVPWKAELVSSLGYLANATAQTDAVANIAEEVARMQKWLDARPSDAPAEVIMQLQVGDVADATTIRIRIERP
jgi:hypothetical protein